MTVSCVIIGEPGEYRQDCDRERQEEKVVFGGPQRNACGHVRNLILNCFHLYNQHLCFTRLQNTYRY